MGGKTHQLFNAFGWLFFNINYDDPILIPYSTNEETYIWKEKNKLFIKTCDNDSFGNYLPKETFVGEDGEFTEPITGEDIYINRDYIKNISFLDMSTMEIVKGRNFVPLWKRHMFGETNKI